MKGISISKLLQMDRHSREAIEGLVAAEIAAELHQRLPRTLKDLEELITTGGKLGQNMSWDVVARDYVLPGMDHALTGRGGAK